MNQNSTSTFSQRLILISALLVFIGASATLSSAAPATPADNWKIVFDPAIDTSFNNSASFTPKIWLYNQGGDPVLTATVTYTYFDVNGNSQIATGTATNNGDGSYRGGILNMPSYAGKYIEVMFSVSAGLNTMREQHVYFAGQSNSAHGAIWKIQVFNTSIGPSWNGNSAQKIYMKLLSDAGIPYRNNFNPPTIAIWNSGGTVVQSATAMAYEEDGVYSYTISGYVNGDYYFEIYDGWSGQPTGGKNRYTEAYAGFYLEANNTQDDESQPEIISVERKPYFPVDDDNVSIVVHAIDNANLASRTLIYSVNNQNKPNISMMPLTGLEYNATINPYLLEDNVRYRVEVSDGTKTTTSDEYMYNVQDHRGSPNMSHSFLNHPVYWFGKSRQTSFADRGGDTNKDGVYSTTEKDNAAYLGVDMLYPYFKDMTTIKVQSLIMDETGKPVQHLTNVKAWLSNTTSQPIGTHNREKIMTEVQGESGVYTVQWDGSANVSGSNLVWSNDSRAIWANYTSGEIYSVYIDVNNDSKPDENITWLAYTFGDTFWGSTEAGKTFSSHSDLESPGSSCGRNSCHSMVGDITTRIGGGPTCADCHGVYKKANNGNWPISGSTTDSILYGNSTSHPRQNNTNATYCGDDTCHNVPWGSANPPSDPVDIPGYPVGTNLTGTFNAQYPNPLQCGEHHNYKAAKIPVEEGHNRMVACKYCHGGSHSNNKLVDYNISVKGTNLSDINKGTPGYVGTGGQNGSGTYAGNCYQDCHRVQVDHSLTGMPGGASQNKAVPCDECHQNFNNAPMHQENVFPYPDRETCGGCHQAQGVITPHNTSITLNPPRMPSPLIHADQSGTSWNKTGARPYWVENENSCRYCHGRSYNQAYGLGRIENFFGTNIINGTINSTNFWCASCHVDNASETRYNYSAMVSVYNYSFGVVPPEITGSTYKSDRSGYDDHNITSKINKLDPGTYSDEKCFTCHGGDILQSAGLDAFLHNVSHGKSGNPDCISCHDTGGSLSQGKKVNFTAMNDTNALHKNLNSLASNGGLSDENKKCWACHGDGTIPSGGHPTNYKTPYKCENCHVQGSGQNLNFTPSSILNVTQHYWNGTNVTTSSVSSCYNCHNRTEMMVGTNLDPDGAASVYGGANGGSNSSSHYGKKRNDMVIMDSTTYCTYCHNTTTNNLTFFVSTFNNSVVNHTSRASTPLCTTCHNNGRIHDTNLAKPASTDTFCKNCHGPGGSAATNNKVEHKNLYCTECHANSSVSTLAGKDIHGIKYLTQSNTFSTTNASAVNCVTCHQTSIVDTSLPGFSPFKIMNPLHHSDNASNGSVWNNYWTSPQGACIYCHSDTRHNATPLGRMLQWVPAYQPFGSISTNTTCANCHYKGDSNYTAMNATFRSSGLNIPPEITNGTSWNGSSANYYNHTLATYQDQDCKVCHGSLLSGSANMSEFPHNVAKGVAGGANCTNCHNIGGSAGAGKLVNISAMNDTNALHKNLNSGVITSLPAENKKCWACHGNGSESSGSHPANYKTPYKCENCHVQGSGQNLNFTPSSILNVTQHYWNGTNITTSGVSSCYNCHNRTEMMVGTNLDPDGAASVYGGANGGNNSTSHYGKKRNDMVIMDSTTYCTYCHNTTTNNLTFFVSTFNNSVVNHTSRASTPLCTTCHNNGRIHDTNLAKPASTDTFCKNCHGPGGSAVTNNKVEHKNLYCTECHANSLTGALAGKDIHAIKFLTKNNTFETTTTNAADCVTCHLTTLVDSSITGFTLFKIMNPLQHSNEVNNGSIWGNYWTSPQTACIYCHNDTKHNASPLGRILQWSPNYQMYTSIGVKGNCADCHYKGGINYTQMSSSFTPGQIPPEITNGTNWNGIYTNYTNHSLENYSDQMCKSCHGTQLNGSTNMSEFLHKVAKGVSGGPDCILCHNIGGTAGSGKLINFSEMSNTSAIHSSLNNNATTSLSAENKKCWACHGNGIEPAAGSHPSNYKNPYKCDYCHILNNYSAPIVQNHIPGNHITTAGRSINTTAYCSTCHNNSISIYDTNNILASVRVNASVSHYGTNASILRPTVNKTSLPRLGFMNPADAQAYNIECTNCHNPSNQNYGNPTQITVAHTSTGACNECHANMSASDLHNDSLGIPQTFGCLDCHTTYASRYRAPNLTGTQMPGFGATSCEGCHGGDTATGLFDTQDKHNVSRDYAGTPGNTDTVYLNNQIALTVTNGTLVTITSRVNDISGPNNYASRVGGAEYYIDIDPGYGNGIPMDAADGQYDAFEGAWEDVTGTIDTSSLLVGTHTVYVRGMDIGKQWSASQNAVLIIQSSSQLLTYIPPTPVINGSVQGNFWINHTWLEGAGNVTNSYNLSVNGLWTNGTTITYSNISVGPHGWSNITVLAYNNSGSGRLSLTSASNSTQVDNHIPVRAQIGNKVVAEGDMLTFTVSATDVDSDPITNSTNATKGTFNPATGEFSWTPGYGDSGIYVWSFNSSDSYGGVASETITVTVNNVPLSIASSSPVTDPITTFGNPQAFVITLNRTGNVTWYINGSSVQSNLGVISASYTNSTAGVGVYNVTITAMDVFDLVSKRWNWTVTQQPSYNVSGYVFDNFGLGLGGVQVQNSSKFNTTSASGYYLITGLFNGTSNLSYTKAGFNTGYLEVTITGRDNTSANKTIYDFSPPAMVTGLKNDTPTQTTVNLTWNVTADTNYYQVFRNSSSLGYTGNIYWNDTGLTANTSYQYWVRANDSYNNWGQNSSTLNVMTATNPEFIPPASVSSINTTKGNFFINNTWTNPLDPDFNYTWFRYSNGTTVQNVSRPANYLNITWAPHYTQNISAQTVDTSGNINQTKIWFNATISNNPPLQSPIGNKIIAENQLLQFTVTATDADSDLITYGTNATKGTFNVSNGQFSWNPAMGDAGVYVWYFNSSDIYGGLASETITVTVNPGIFNNCLGCHNNPQGVYPAIVQASFSKHKNVNTTGGTNVLNNSDCVTCHYEISNMTQLGIKTRTCTDCHTQGNFSAQIIKNHRPGGLNINTTAYCSTCHNNSVNMFAYNPNTSVSHYVTNSSLLKPTVNHTTLPELGFMTQEEASANNNECTNCHNNYPFNTTYGNATTITVGHTSTGTCNQCHLNTDASDLHNGSLIKPVTSSCIECHTKYADAYKAPNLTNTNHMGYDCTYTCHVPVDYGTPGRFDPSDHNTDWEFSPGNPPTTDIVSLNGAASLTVSRGVTVVISSRIKDYNFLASRVRGAEYYIDSDPGWRKGNVMSAADGRFDAFNGGWENISGTMDTSSLSVGAHTVYVRGMDIGKQWSTSVAATLNITAPTGFINGTVRNTTGTVLPGTRVTTNTGVSSDTDNSGFYSLSLTNGTYTLNATKLPEYNVNNTIPQVTVTAYTTVTQDIFVTKKATGNIRGAVGNV